MHHLPHSVYFEPGIPTCIFRCGYVDRQVISSRPPTAVIAARASATGARQMENTDGLGSIDDKGVLGWETTPGNLDPAHQAAIEAVQASVRAGFRFRYLPTIDNIVALQGIRISSGAMDMYLAQAPGDAIAARFRIDDLEQGRTPQALWHRRGAVTDVVFGLLELPPHGSPGAPTLARLRPSDLWVPGDALS